MIVVAFVLVVSAIRSNSADGQQLGRVFHLNEKLAYSVRSSLHAERRGGELLTWMPEDLEINYDFSTVAVGLKADGIAVIRYARPSIETVEGETFDQPAKTTVAKSNIHVLLTVSPNNEILDYKGVVSSKSAGSIPLSWTANLFYSSRQQSVTDFIEPFIDEIHRLSLFAGPVQSSLDFAPETPFKPLQIGETWKRTVGYQPQALKGKLGKFAVQRLDYTYTYKGQVNGETGKVLRVEASLDYKTDLIEFVHELTSSTSTETGIKSLPVRFAATIEFDLDPKTRDTLKAEATAKSGFQILGSDESNPSLEERITGHSTMRLVGRKFLSSRMGSG